MNNKLFLQLTERYERMRKKTALDPVRHYTQADVTEYMQKFSAWLVETDRMASRKELKKLDTIDYSLTLDPTKQTKSDLPAMSLSDECTAALDECWYMLIPPLTRGCLRINVNRYIQFEVEKIDEERKRYAAVLADYAFDQGVWMLNNTVTGYTSLELWNQNRRIFSECGGASMADLVLFALDNYDMEVWSYNEKLFLKEVVAPYLRSTEKEDDFQDIFAHFSMAIINTNYQLMQKKPKAVRGSGRRYKDVVGELEGNPKPQIVRTLSGGITISSVKVPKVPTTEVIRKYKLAAWNTRGHIRTYKNGKTTYVKPSVHHRKCLANKEEMVPQTIIKVAQVG